VLCHLSPPWSLLVFDGCDFALNKDFLLHRSTLMDDLWDEGLLGVMGYPSRLGYFGVNGYLSRPV
jgi:hypothetical protein